MTGTPRFVSYTSFDFTNCTVVPVIASFDTTGHICPLYVRIEGISYKIQSYYVQSGYSHITEFRCKIIDGEIEKPIALSYYSAEGMWTLLKSA